MPETLSESELDEVYARFEEYSKMQHPLPWNHVIVGRILATLRLSRNEVATRMAEMIDDCISPETLNKYLELVPCQICGKLAERAPL